MKAPSCSSCSSEMLEGFVLDHGHYQYKAQQMWVEGTPEPSFWSGLKTSGRAAYYVTAFRCPDCGRLEFFAAAKAETSVFGSKFQ